MIATLEKRFERIRWLAEQEACGKKLADGDPEELGLLEMDPEMAHRYAAIKRTKCDEQLPVDVPEFPFSKLRRGVGAYG